MITDLPIMLGCGQKLQIFGLLLYESFETYSLGFG